MIKRLLLQMLLLPVFPCFMKGPDPNAVQEQERANAETAARMYDLYLEGKPVTNAYIEDVSRDPFTTANAAQGQAAVDLAKKAPPTMDPTRGANVAGATGMAGIRSKVMGDISQDAVSQRAAGMKSVVENALGLQSTADTAMTGLAEDAVNRNINSAQAHYEGRAATMGSLSSLAGAGAGMAVYANRKG